MFPVSDVIPSRTTPVVTIGLMALNAALFAYELQLDNPALHRLFVTLGLQPADFSWPAVLTSQFLHAGWLHAICNLVYLWIFGGNVEQAFGRSAFLVFAVACGALAALVHAVAHPWSTAPFVGAGGAVAGIMGAYLVLYPRSRVLAAVLVPLYLDVVEIPAVFFVGLWFVLQLFSGVGSLGAHAADGALALWAHGAGFATGVICGAYARFGAGSLHRYWHNA